MTQTLQTKTTDMVLLHKLAAQHDLPDYVKQAVESDLAPSELHKIAAGTYIRVDNEVYPAHNKAATWVSFAKLANAGDSVSQRMKVAEFLLARAELFGIKDDCLQVNLDLEHSEKLAAETDESYPVRNGTEYTAALDFLSRELESPRSTTHADRVELANKLAAFGGDNEPAVRIAACTHGCYDTNKLVANIKQAAGDQAYDDMLACTLGKVRTLLDGEPLQRVATKLASLLERSSVDLGKSPEMVLQTAPTDDVVSLPNLTVVSKEAIENCDLPCLQSSGSKTAAELTIGVGDLRCKVAASELSSDEVSQVIDYLKENEPDSLYYIGKRSLNVVGL